MRLGWSGIGALAFAILSACGPAGKVDAGSDRKLDGYAGLKLGSTFEEAMLIANPRDFNPYGLKKCLEDMPIKGCILFPESDRTTFQRVQGIPYGLQLEFNRLGALTDITLRFSRRRTFDDDLNPVQAKITKAECSDILNRTVDWISADYGPLTPMRPKNSQDQPAKTEKGSSYWVEDSRDKTGFVAIATVKMGDGRSVGLFAHFLLLDRDPDCEIQVSFEEVESVERAVNDSDKQAGLAQVVDKVATPKAQGPRRFPYVTADGVDITNEEDERNWKRYGTTDPDGGE